MTHADLRRWITHIQEAYEGETTLKQAITRNHTQYGAEADRMQKAGGEPPADYPQLKTAADLMHMLHDHVTELSQSDALKQGAGMVLLSRLKSHNLDQMAQQLDRIAKIPQPKSDTK
jgi:hypothetical protein